MIAVLRDALLIETAECVLPLTGGKAKSLCLYLRYTLASLKAFSLLIAVRWVAILVTAA